LGSVLVEVRVLKRKFDGEWEGRGVRVGRGMGGKEGKEVEGRKESVEKRQWRGVKWKEGKEMKEGRGGTG